jgi:hypothetical protein
MKRSLRSIAVFFLSIFALSLTPVSNVRAATTEVAIFQCNLFTSAIFNVQAYGVSVTASWTCAEALEVLMNEGLTDVNASYQSSSNGTNGNYMTFVLTNGTAGGL